MECTIATMTLPLLFLLPLLLFLLKPSRSQSPPSPSSLPFIGHLHHLLLSPSPPHHLFAHLAETLNTKILLLRLGRVPTAVISSPDLAAEVLKTHDQLLASRPALLSAQYLSFGCSDVTFSPLGPYWRQARRICVSELLAPRRVSSFSAVRREEADLLINSLILEREREVNMSEKLFELANGVLCRVAFGKKMREGERMREVLDESQRLFAGFEGGEFFPGIVGEILNAATGLRGRLERNLSDLRKVGDEIIREHKERERRENEGEDFVDVLLRVQRDGSLEVPLTDDNVKALVMDMFVAGTDTTAATLEWAMTELPRHPAAMAKAQAEIRSHVAARGGAATPQESDLPGFRYLTILVQETLRLHPPAPLLVPREALGSCTIGGAAIAPGTRVLVNVHAIGRSAACWRNPNDFLPERFEEEEKIEFKFLPFGGGRRGCPGSTFALATVQLTLAKLLCHFDWSLPDGMKADDVDMEELFGLATKKKAPLLLVPKVNVDFYP